MCEELLPPSVVSKATLSGSEYAWSLEAVEKTVTAAAACGLANLGGQAQFRIPDGICDLYWLSGAHNSHLQSTARSLLRMRTCGNKGRGVHSCQAGPRDEGADTDEHITLATRCQRR